MRAWELALLIIFVEMSVGFLDGLGTFDHKYVMSEEWGENKYTLEATEDLLSMDTDVTVSDYFAMGVSYVFAGLNFLITVFTPLITIFPLLTTKFGCPADFAAMIQAGIYLYLGIALYQWKANRSESIMT